MGLQILDPPHSRFLPSSQEVEVAALVIMCTVSVVIPASYCALGVGDPFMREGIEYQHYRDDPNTIKLSLLKTRSMVATDSNESEGRRPIGV